MQPSLFSGNAPITGYSPAAVSRAAATGIVVKLARVSRITAISGYLT